MWSHGQIKLNHNGTNSNVGFANPDPCVSYVTSAVGYFLFGHDSCKLFLKLAQQRLSVDNQEANDFLVRKAKFIRLYDLSC